MAKSRKINPEISPLGKIPPNAKETEVSVLGTILLEKAFDIKAFDLVSGILKPECFYVDAHKTVFTAMQNLVKKHQPIDSITVFQELKAMDELENIGGMYALTKLTDGIRSGESIETHARIIYEKFKARELIRVTGEINTLAYDEGEDIFSLMSFAENSIKEIGVHDLDGGMAHISKVIGEAMNKVEEWKRSGSHVTGISSGFRLIDLATRGWQPGDLIVVAARPSVGKTAFALNLVRNAADSLKEKTTVAVWSLEMKSYLLALRLISAESGTYLTRLQTGKISDSDIQRLYKNSLEKLSSLNIFFDESNSATINSVSRKARYLKRKKNLGLIVIDYLQLMSGDENSGNREREVAKISRDLKNLAQELNVPIIALSQLSREMGSKNISWEYGPPISAIRESGAIEQDADVIMMLWGPSDEDKAKDPTLDGKRRARIAKQRNGVLITQEFDFKNDIQLFKAVEEGAQKPDGNWRPVDRYEVDKD